MRKLDRAANRANQHAWPNLRTLRAAAWEVLGESLPRRELIYLEGLGGHPGGSWAEIVCAHDLPGGTRVYTWETDIADVGQQFTFLIATTNKPSEEIDARVAESALSIREPGGLELARTAMRGTLDEMRTVLPRRRIWPLLVEVLDEIGDAFIDADDRILEELVKEAPEDLRPWGPAWKRWLVEAYIGPCIVE